MYLCQTPAHSVEETGTKGRSGEDLISLGFFGFSGTAQGKAMVDLAHILLGA